MSVNYNFSEITFPSRDGIHTIYAELYTPKHCAAKGIVQLAHGMVDHVGRYKALAEYLTGEGYIFAGHNHLGHGKSAGHSDDLGYFADKDGVEYLLKDMHTMNKYLRETFPTLPLVVLGHSMGSFITRLYIEAYPHSLRGAVILGTSGPNKLLPFGRALTKLVGAFRGGRYRSRMITKLAFGAYNSKFSKSDGKNAWLTRDTDRVSDKETDKYASFHFTTFGYRDLFYMIAKCNSKEWFENYPKDLPTVIMSGDADPVGNYGKGPDYVYKHLLIAGASNVSLKLYAGARHELFNESNSDEFFSDLKNWLDGIK